MDEGVESFPAVEVEAGESAPEHISDRLARERGLIWEFWIVLYPGAVSALSVLPVLALGPLAFAIRRDFPLGPSDIGLVTSGFFLGSAVCASLGSRLANRVRSVIVVRAGVLLSGGLSAVIAMADNRALLVVGCLLAGATNGLIAPAVNLLIMQLVPTRRRGLAFGVKAAAIPAAASLGAVGTWLIASYGFHWQWLYLMTSAVAVFLVGIAVRFGAGKVRTPRPRRPKQRSRSPRSLRLLGLGGLLGSTGTAVLAPFLVDGLVAHGESPADAARVLAISGWLGIVVRLLVGGAADRFPRPLVHLFLAASMLAAGSVGILGIAVGGPTWILMGASLLAFGLGWSWPGLFHFAVMSTYRDNQAAATSLVQTGTFVGAVVGPLGFGLVAEHAGYSWAWGVSAGAVLLSAVLLQAGIWDLRRQRPAAPQA